MKIECPECKLSGSIGDDVVPATGLAMNCPRCKARFVVERPGAANAAALMDSCPACQYATFSEERFSVCPRCGLVVADYLRQKLAERGRSAPPRPAPQEVVAPLTAEQQRREDEARRKYGLDGVNDVPAAPSLAELPTPLQLVGWGTVAIALGVVVYGGWGVADYLKRLDEARAALLAGDKAPSDAIIFLRHALFPLLMIVYGIAMAVLANRFLALRPWTVRWLEIGGWAGVALGGMMELAEMVAWCSRASSNATFGYYATGLGGGLLMALLWMAPPFVLVEYLRSEQFDELRRHFD
jgi:hypothetical protein